VENSLSDLDGTFQSLGYPRPGLYIMQCEATAPLGGFNRPFCNAWHFPRPSLALEYMEDVRGTFRGSAGASLAYFIPTPPPGKRVGSARLRVFANVVFGEVSGLSLSGKPPTSIEVLSCRGSPNCNLWVTWDLTEEARRLAGQGGGHFDLSLDPIPPTVFGPGNNSAWYVLFPDVNYPWTHGGPSGALTISFEEDCPKELKLEVDRESVRPRPSRTSSGEVATIRAQVKSCPPEGETPPPSVEVTFKLKPPAGSAEAGGHDQGHVDPRPDHAFGSFERPEGPKVSYCTVTTFDAGEIGFCEVTYHPSEVSGKETVTAEASGFPKAEAKVIVQVPGLRQMPASGLGAWQLTGARPQHPGNHYGTPETVTRIAAMATDYFELYGESIGVNDMSLEWGGLFDIGGNWAPPHAGHRIGNSVDIDRCAQTLVKQRDLDRIARDSYSGTRTVEKALQPPSCPGPAETPRIHYDFP
jgi:hypothetical protein